VTLNSEEIRPTMLAISELCLSEGIGLSNSQWKILLNKNFFFLISKFHSNAEQRFRVDLKTF